MEKLVFCVSSELGHSLRFELGGEARTRRAARIPKDLVQARRCPDCRDAGTAGLCPLLDNCLEVIRFFSKETSCAKMSVRCETPGGTTFFSNTSQRVTSLLLIYCMVYSRCHFFSRFRRVMPYYGCVTSPEALAHMIVTTALAERHLAGRGTGDHGPAAAIKEFNDQVARRLECIFESVESLPAEDSLRNAFQILHSVNYITREHFEDFLKGLNGDSMAIPGRKEDDGLGGCSTWA